MRPFVGVAGALGATLGLLAVYLGRGEYGYQLHGHGLTNAIRRLLGGKPDQWPELYRRVAPITHVGPNTPPTLRFVGEHDVYVSRVGAVLALHRKLQEAGVPSVCVELLQTDHAFDMFIPELSPAAQAAMYDVDRFLALMALPPSAVEAPVEEGQT